MVYYSVVIYERKPDWTFDMPYYLATHMPLVMEQWAKFGLKSYVVKDFQFKSDGTMPPFTVLADLVWESKEGLQEALKSKDAETVFADVPNFSNNRPIFMGAAEAGTSK